MHEETLIWSEVLVCKYRGQRGLSSAVVSRNSSIWRRHLSLVRGGTNVGRWFDALVGRKVGNDVNILFWKDIWMGDQPLAHNCQRVFLNSNKKEMFIEIMGEWCVEGWRWRF